VVSGLISGWEDFQRPMEEGAKLFHAIQMLPTPQDIPNADVPGLAMALSLEGLASPDDELMQSLHLLDTNCSQGCAIADSSLFTAPHLIWSIQ